MEYNLLNKYNKAEEDYRQKTYEIIGAAMEVHRQLGNGFHEAVYGDALAIEFKCRNIPFEREKTFKISYKGVELPHTYIADFVCFSNIIVELKAVETTQDIHRSQVINYLHASNTPIALLINFGQASLQFERLRN